MPQRSLKVWLCENKDHEGDRVIVSPYDRWVADINIMKADGSERRTRSAGGGIKGGLHLCKVCADKWDTMLKHGAMALEYGQETLGFGEDTKP